MFVQNINPTLFSFGGFEIRYYGIIYVLGFLLALFWLPKLAKKYNLHGIDQKFVDDFIFWAIIGDLIGARLFHVFLYEPAYYLKNPLEIVMLWHGGLSFHGGFLGVIIAASFGYCALFWQDC